MLFDLVVVIMTLVRTIKINKASGGDRTLIHVLIRDGKRISSSLSIPLSSLSRCHLLCVHPVSCVEIPKEIK